MKDPTRGGDTHRPGIRQCCIVLPNPRVCDAKQWRDNDHRTRQDGTNSTGTRLDRGMTGVEKQPPVSEARRAMLEGEKTS